MSTRQVWQDPDTGKLTAPQAPASVVLNLDIDVRCAQEALAQVVTFIAELPRGDRQLEALVSETRIRTHVLDLASSLNYLRDNVDSLNEWVRQQKAAQAEEVDAA